MRTPLFLAISVFLAACTGEPSQTPQQPAGQSPAPAQKPAEKPAEKPAGKPAEDPVAAMNKAIATLMAKSEQTVETIEVEHVLIGFKGAPRLQATRSKEEAEKLAADVYARAMAGEDFSAMRKKLSDDGGGGIYPMTNGTTRKQMVAAFGDVGFRLQVGEIGVAPWDATKSPFGWHIIKRTK